LGLIKEFFVLFKENNVNNNPIKNTNYECPSFDKIYAPRSWMNIDKHFSAAIKNPWYSVIFDLTSHIFDTSIDFFRTQKYKAALMPITCGSVSSPMGLGSDSLPVEIELFGKKTYLADSMQFQLEYMLRQYPIGVYYIMPTFRGEEPDTTHLNQFFHSEAEIIGDLDTVMKLIENYIKLLTRSIYDKYSESIYRCAGSVSHLEKLLNLNGNFKEINFNDALYLLKDSPNTIEQIEGGGFKITRKGEQELLMMNDANPLWLKNPDSSTVPFYQALNIDGKTSKCADLLLGIGEIIGCGERHYSEESVLNAIHQHQVDPKEYDWYLRMKREYPLKTSGFGLGIERYLMWLLRHEDIRDIHLIPRLKGYNHAP
jgi:asparaginyl-tRNA synthetase